MYIFIDIGAKSSSLRSFSSCTKYTKSNCDDFSLHLAGNENSIAESLLLLLDSFPEPVIPFAMHLKCLDSAHNYTACKQVRLIINELVLFSILPTKVEVCIFHF